MEIHISGNYTELDFPKFGASYLMIFMNYAHSKSKIFVYLQIVKRIYAENHSSFPCAHSNFVLFQVASFFLLICNPFYTAQQKPIVCSEW